MRALLEFFVRRPLVVNTLLVMFFLCGALAMSSLPYNALPSIDTGLVAVVTHHPGASAEDIELSVTAPLERELLRIDGVDKLWSDSVEGRSTIIVAGHPDDPVERYEQLEAEVYNAIERARREMPGVDPEVSRPENFTSTPLVEVLVTGSVPEETLREVARQVGLELRNLKGVARVEREGYRDREVLVLLDEVRLRQLGFSHQQVIDAIGAQRTDGAASVLQTATGTRDTLAISAFGQPGELEELILRQGPGGDVRLRDVARVQRGFTPASVRTAVNGRPAITLLVKAGEKADRLGTGLRVKQYAREKNLALPGDVELVLVRDDTLATLDLLDVLATNAIAGMALVILVLMCFFSFRHTVWVALGIPTSIMMVFCLLPVLGLSVNLLSMVALILMLGILVDDSVVTAESIFRHYEYGHPPVEAAVTGAHAVMLPVCTSALTTVVALAPAAFLGGVQGKVFYIVPVMAILVLVMSLFECKLMLPAHIARSLQGAGTGKLTRSWFARVEDAYEALMMRIIPHRYLFTLLLLAIFAVAGVQAARSAVFVSVPETNADAVFIKVEAPVGTPLAETWARLSALEQEARNIVPAADLEQMVLTVGHHDHSRGNLSEGMNPAWGMLAIYLQPAGERETNALTLRDELVAVYAQREGFQRLSVKVAGMSFRPGLPLETVVIGNSADRFLAVDLLMDYVRGIPGVTEVWSDYVPGKPVIDLRIDQEALARYGVTVGQVSAAVQLAFNGQVVASVETLEDTVTYRVKVDGVDPGDPASLYSLVVSNERGDGILLRNLADFELRPGEGAVRHYFGERATTVFATIDRDMLSSAALSERVERYLEDSGLAGRFSQLSFQQAGEQVTGKVQVERFVVALAIALIAIFFILLLLFHSVLQPFMVLVMIPLGVVGVLVAFVAQDRVLSFAAMIGIAGLMGVIVNDALVMLHRFNQERRRHSRRGETLLHDRQIVECASVRLRPVIITTVTTCAGLLPATYELGGGNELLTPMITVMFWGVLVASVVTLFLLPCLYAMERDLLARLRPAYARQALEEVIMYN